MPARFVLRTKAAKRLRRSVCLAAGWFGVFTFTTSQHSAAQSCSGATAEVLIRESFGTAEATASLSGRTSYQYATKACPDNGEYTIASAVDRTCFGSVWHGLPTDHTGNAGGAMLIVNGSDLPGEFFRQTIPGLCGGTTYEFSVWGLNLLQPNNCTDSSLPNLTIEIETAGGRPLRRIDIGSIPETVTPEWRRFSASFTMPETDEPVLVKLINNAAAGGCGNDLALDDLELIRCSACPPEPVYVPDAFTPNHDGHNDRLAIYLAEAVSVDIKILDRWGSLVYASNTLTEQWDGRFGGVDCPSGGYTWIVTYRVADSPTTTSTYVRSGRVMLLR
ncbi:gliding motility-associated C-terminal domain-containing protein [Rudanella lutea]|uniref:T9SS type B sorting domain-containing protein n=1 Tax=Rudanella lutea TaxID=451374 RepID=UPI0003738DC1|nr:gliding motility-associated C-terminal domain-containing protein [Rudanella lutea]